jgi:hypothetical protein
MDSSIGVLLTSHKRPHTLRPQLAAIDAQTVKPDDVIIWHNDGGVQPDAEAMRGRKVVAANFNSGVWARFSAALWLLPYEFIVVLDDDTIPGSRWLETCLDHYESKPALLGVNGVTFGAGKRENRLYYGTNSATDRGGPRKSVDIVGHGFFVHESILRQACQQVSMVELFSAGEDYHLAFSAQKLGLHTDVPCHIYPETRGSTNPSLGSDDVALYRQPGEEEKKAKAHDAYVRAGMKMLGKVQGRRAVHA